MLFDEPPRNGELAAPFRVLIIGSSYGGLATALNLLDLCQRRPTRFKPEQKLTPVSPVELPVQITLVDERDGFFHLIGSPLALASREYAAEAWVATEEIPALKDPRLRCVQGSVVRVDCAAKAATIVKHGSRVQVEEKYDYLVASTGLRRAWPVVPQSLTRKEYLDEALGHISAVENANGPIVVIGGGAVGVEMAAETKMIWPNLDMKLIHSRDKLLSSEGLPDEFKDQTAVLLEEMGVEVIRGCRVVDTTRTQVNNRPAFTIKMSNGTEIAAGHVINAISTQKPSTSYLPAPALDKDGFVRITPSLNFPATVPNSSAHFAVGDIAAWSGIKRCGGALHMGQYAAINIYQRILERVTGSLPKLLSLHEFQKGIAIALGKGAICYYPSEGMKFGGHMMDVMFGKDLGRKNTWNYLKLSDEQKPSPVVKENGVNGTA